MRFAIYMLMLIAGCMYLFNPDMVDYEAELSARKSRLQNVQPVVSTNSRFFPESVLPESADLLDRKLQGTPVQTVLVQTKRTDYYLLSVFEVRMRNRPEPVYAVGFLSKFFCLSR